MRPPPSEREAWEMGAPRRAPTTVYKQNTSIEMLFHNRPNPEQPVAAVNNRHRSFRLRRAYRSVAAWRLPLRRWPDL